VIVRNPLKDQVAIVGVGTTPFARSLPGRTPQSLALEASKQAILEAGLSAADIDGISASAMPYYGSAGVNPVWLQEALGIPETTWDATVAIPFPYTLGAAVTAVFSGACTTALVVHSLYRVGPSRSAMDDPFRKRWFPSMSGPRPPHGASDGYAAFAARYMHDYGATKEDFGLVAINERSNAARNPHAVMREPFTMDDYLEARMVRWPLAILDMDVPIDGADAVVVTTAERARDLAKQPVYVHAITSGRTEHPTVAGTESLERNAHHVVVEALRQKSDIGLTESDLFFAYDGFTVITLNWIENVGYCAKGEAPAFLRQHWDDDANAVRIDGRMPLNPHGGNLSEGATQGSGHVREAVVQLRGEAGDRQVPYDPKTSVLVLGGMYMNGIGTVLRTDP
jgi:acetyl-CoA acetyltransferase